MRANQNTAFPVVGPNEMHIQSNGLSKREMIAAMAMQGYCANSALYYRTSETLAQWSILQADALLAALATPEVQP